LENKAAKTVNMAVQRKPQLKAEIENITTQKRELRKNPE